jgi:hypothetical protein
MTTASTTTGSPRAEGFGPDVSDIHVDTVALCTLCVTAGAALP